MENGEALAHLREAVAELKAVQESHKLPEAWLHAWKRETKTIEDLKSKFEYDNANVYYQVRFSFAL